MGGECRCVSMRTWRESLACYKLGRRMRGRARRRAADHPTCAGRLHRAQAASLPAAVRALPAVGEHEREPRGRVVPVQRHGPGLRGRRALARQQRRYLRADGLGRAGRRRLVFGGRLPRYRQFLLGRRRVLRVDFLSGRGGLGAGVRGRRQVVDAPEREPDLAEHLRVVRFLITVIVCPIRACSSEM